MKKQETSRDKQGGHQVWGTLQSSILGPVPADDQGARLLHTVDRNGVASLEPVVIDIIPLLLVGDLSELELVADKDSWRCHAQVVLGHSIVVIVNFVCIVIWLPQAQRTVIFDARHCSIEVREPIGAEFGSFGISWFWTGDTADETPLFFTDTEAEWLVFDGYRLIESHFNSHGVRIVASNLILKVVQVALR